MSMRLESSKVSCLVSFGAGLTPLALTGDLASAEIRSDPPAGVAVLLADMDG